MTNPHFLFLLIIITDTHFCYLIYFIDQKTIVFSNLIVKQFAIVPLISTIISLLKLFICLDKTLLQIIVKSQSSFLLEYMHHDS